MTWEQFRATRRCLGYYDPVDVQRDVDLLTALLTVALERLDARRPSPSLPGPRGEETSMGGCYSHIGGTLLEVHYG